MDPNQGDTHPFQGQARDFPTPLTDHFQEDILTELGLYVFKEDEELDLYSSLSSMDLCQPPSFLWAHGACGDDHGSSQGLNGADPDPSKQVRRVSTGTSARLAPLLPLPPAVPPRPPLSNAQKRFSCNLTMPSARLNRSNTAVDHVRITPGSALLTHTQEALVHYRGCSSQFYCLSLFVLFYLSGRLEHQTHRHATRQHQTAGLALHVNIQVRKPSATQ